MCADVTEFQCDIIPYTDCKMVMHNTTYRSNEDVTKIYKPWVCEEHTRIIQHEKLLPVCKKVTKENCITIWKADKNGNPVSVYSFMFLELSSLPNVS